MDFQLERQKALSHYTEEISGVLKELRKFPPASVY